MSRIHPIPAPPFRLASIGRMRAARGFTLIELIVAMAIFAVLALSGWYVFDNLVKIRERTALKAAQLTDIQLAYEQLSRDMVQAIPRPAEVDGGVEDALIINNNELHLTKTGVIDPLHLGVSPLERVVYTVEQGRLIRRAYAPVDQTGHLAPTETILLKDVTDWSVNALANSTSPVWPMASTAVSSPAATAPQGNTLLPLAVQITLSAHDQPLRWVFPLVANLPQTTTASSAASTPASTVQSTGGAAATSTSTSTVPLNSAPTDTSATVSGVPVSQ